MGYCFMTLEKVKSFNQLAGKYRHNFRKIEVSNADPEKAELNEELVPLQGKNYKEAFEARLKEVGYTKKIRSNAVYAFEVVTTFSREDKEHMDLEKWKENNVKWLREQFNANPEKYGDNVISVMYHADEPGNVHCHAIIVPIDDQGKLNARYYVRSRQKMIELQDSYGKLMKKEHNLNRGIKHSKARHQDIKRYYASLNQTLEQSLPDPKAQETALEYKKRVNELYRESLLKTMALEDKNKRLSMAGKQEIENAKSSVRKDFYEKYQKKAEQFEELERELGPVSEIKKKCSDYDDLIAGIAIQDDQIDIIKVVDQLMEEGHRYLEKEKEKGNGETSL